MLLMYLNKDCKDKVMDLAIYIALANDALDKSEADSLNQYYQELGIANRGTNTNLSFDECVEYLSKNTSFMEKKIIIFEIIALAYVDGVCDEKEENLLGEIYSKFEIDQEVVNELHLLIIKLRGIYGEIAEFIERNE